MKIILTEKQNEALNELIKNPNLFVMPDNWKKIKPFEYNNEPVTLYFNNDNNEFYLNTIGTKKTRVVPDSEYMNVGSALQPMSSNLLNKMKSKYTELNNVNSEPITKPSTPQQTSKEPIVNPSIAPKKSGIITTTDLKKYNTPNVDQKEQKWVGLWEKFLTKYVGFSGGDKTNSTSTIDNAVFNFINTHKNLYAMNKNVNSPQLKTLMTDGKKGIVHYSFLPPFYIKTNTLPIYFYQKSDKVMEMQKKMGVKATGIFLNQTESALIKRLAFKATEGQGYNVKYNRRTGITDEIYKVIMSNDTKNDLGNPQMINKKGEI